MIKAKAKQGDKELLMIGLSHENLKRLKDDMPIVFNLKDMGMQDCEILIFSGETEQVMTDMLKDGMHQGTKVHQDG